MKEITISEFKAKCFGILAQVRRTCQPIRVTRRGQPLAEIVPISPRKPTRRRLGSMAGTAQILGDIVGAVSDQSDGEAER